MNDEQKINADIRFERRDASLRALLWIGAGIVAAAIIIHFALYGLYRVFNKSAARAGRIPATRKQAQPQTPDAPQLQVNPAADMKQFREQENQKLDSYGWIDKQKGAVRIPVEQAMKIIAERGLPKTNGVQTTDNPPPAPSAPQAQKRK